MSPAWELSGTPLPRRYKPRIGTQAVSDYLGVPQQREPSAVACSTLSKLMQSQGWTPVRFRGITRGGYSTKCADTLGRRREFRSARRSDRYLGKVTTFKGLVAHTVFVRSRPALRFV
jgi:hypothetical protein